MDPSKKQATGAQITYLTEFMQLNPDLAKGVVNSSLEREQLETQWRDLAASLNAMGGAVKAVDKWKQVKKRRMRKHFFTESPGDKEKTWRDLKSNSKKRALKGTQCDGEGGDSSQYPDGESYVPPKKKAVSFDEELLRIEREKLDLDQDYKAKKIEVLSRIATALEELAKKREK